MKNPSSSPVSFNAKSFFSEFIQICENYLSHIEQKKTSNPHKKYLVEALKSIFEKFPNENKETRLINIQLQIVINVFSYAPLLIEEKAKNYVKDSYLNYDNEKRKSKKILDAAKNKITKKVSLDGSGKFLTKISKLCQSFKAEEMYIEESYKKKNKADAIKEYKEAMSYLGEIKRDHSFDELEEALLEFLGQAFFYLMRKGTQIGRHLEKIEKLKKLSSLIANFLANYKSQAFSKNTNMISIVLEAKECIKISGYKGSGTESVSLKAVCFSFLNKMVLILCRKNFFETKEEWELFLKQIDLDNQKNPHSSLVEEKIKKFLDSSGNISNNNNSIEIIGDKLNASSEIKKKLDSLETILVSYRENEKNRLLPFNSEQYLKTYANEIYLSLKFLVENKEGMDEIQKQKVFTLYEMFNSFKLIGLDNKLKKFLSANQNILKNFNIVVDSLMDINSKFKKSYEKHEGVDDDFNFFRNDGFYLMQKKHSNQRDFESAKYLFNVFNFIFNLDESVRPCVIFLLGEEFSLPSYDFFELSEKSLKYQVEVKKESLGIKLLITYAQLGDEIKNAFQCEIYIHHKSINQTLICHHSFSERKQDKRILEYSIEKNKPILIVGFNHLLSIDAYVAIWKGWKFNLNLWSKEKRREKIEGNYANYKKILEDMIDKENALIVNSNLLNPLSEIIFSSLKIMPNINFKTLLFSILKEIVMDYAEYNLKKGPAFLELLEDTLYKDEKLTFYNEQLAVFEVTEKKHSEEDQLAALRNTYLSPDAMWKKPLPNSKSKRNTINFDEEDFCVIEAEENKTDYKQ